MASSSTGKQAMSVFRLNRDRDWISKNLVKLLKRPTIKEANDVIPYLPGTSSRQVENWASNGGNGSSGRAVANAAFPIHDDRGDLRTGSSGESKLRAVEKLSSLANLRGNWIVMGPRIAVSYLE
jgi:hypothetical protein